MHRQTDLPRKAEEKITTNDNEVGGHHARVGIL